MTRRPDRRGPTTWRDRLARAVATIAAASGLVGVLGLVAGPALAATPRVAILTATGVVDNVLAGYIDEGIRRAERDGADAVVIRLDTPGGSLEATNRIVSSLLEAPLPTIVWVSPAGGRAASAGTFITLAAHVAVMAPGTNIGAASPVGQGGEDIEGTLGDKVRNDAIAKIRAIAETRGRNVEWAIATVAEARSSPATEALEEGAIDGLAADLDDVLELATGRTVTVGGREVTLALTGATADDLALNPLQGFLHLLSDPNIAFILFTVGFYGLLFELQNPNFVTGILGALAIVLAFIGFGSLPLNVAGLLLLGLAVILFALEFTVTSHGLLTVGGLVCFVLGAAALYTEPGGPTAPDVSVAIPVIGVMTAITAGFALLGIVTVFRVRRRALAFAGGYGAGGSMRVPHGEAGVARTALDPAGVVHAAGEEWTARTHDGAPLPAGTPIRVVDQDDLTLIVEAMAEPGPATSH